MTPLTGRMPTSGPSTWSACWRWTRCRRSATGHPGTAMCLAPAAYLLFQDVLRHDPADPKWPGRDRFVLSCGHSSLTLYIQLYLSGYGLGARRPEGVPHLGLAHPRPPRARPDRRRRDHHRPARPGHRQRGRHGDGRPPRARPARPRRRAGHLAVRPLRLLLSSPTATSRRASPTRPPRSPGTQELGNLIVHLRRQPHLDRGQHDIAKSEDVGARYEAYGWHVQHVTGAPPTATTRTSRRCTTPSRRPRRHRQAVVHRAAHDHRLARADQAEHRAPRTAPRSARPRSRRPRRSSASTRP